ncbi:MAG TPA: GGDEF domain-containing protein [Telluria sp.]|nr:GGDEF domain-containing protein [Telluria sp.]
MMVLNQFFRVLSYRSVVLLAFAAIAGIGVLDYLFGSEISLFIFYLIPVGIATWYADTTAGWLCAILSDLPLLAEQAGTTAFVGRPGAMIWALVMQSGLMLIVVYLLNRLKELLDREAALARTDAVTGILNRRGFVERLEFTIALARREKLCFALAIVDLDNFKAINDSGGHAEGDRVLCLAARIFTESTRHSDVAARLGGDEFALLLHGLTPATAHVFLDDLRATFRRVFEREQMRVTCSIGCAVFGSSPPDAGEVFKIADALMYDVKRQGKNNVVIGDYALPRSSEQSA